MIKKIAIVVLSIGLLTLVACAPTPAPTPGPGPAPPDPNIGYYKSAGRIMGGLARTAEIVPVVLAKHEDINRGFCSISALQNATDSASAGQILTQQIGIIWTAYDVNDPYAIPVILGINVVWGELSQYIQAQPSAQALSYIQAFAAGCDSGYHPVCTSSLHFDGMRAAQ